MASPTIPTRCLAGSMALRVRRHVHAPLALLRLGLKVGGAAHLHLAVLNVDLLLGEEVGLRRLLLPDTAGSCQNAAFLYTIDPGRTSMPKTPRSLRVYLAARPVIRPIHRYIVVHFMRQSPAPPAPRIQPAFGSGRIFDRSDSRSIMALKAHTQVIIALAAILGSATASICGEISNFDVPGAGTAPGQGTFGEAINTEGTTPGWFIDTTGLYHGFIRDCGGKTTSFDAPDSGTTPGSYQGTVPQSMNVVGEIVGYVADNQNVYHGFVRSP